MTDQGGAQAVTCPGCGRQLRARSLVPGKSYKCPACGGIIRVPQSTGKIEALSPSPDSDVTLDLGARAAPAAGKPASGEISVEGMETKPKFLGRYHILSEIARGGMGVVYKARDPKLNRVVALKVLLAGEGASRESIARFVREARSAAGLKHPGIVQVHDFGEVEGQHFFTMDYVDGRPLDDLIKSGELSTDAALEIILVVARSLQFAHEKGIIHRDLKPPNILITRDGAPVLTDFGLAKDIGDTSLSITGTIFGTPAYMSPEQAQGHSAQIDGRSDVYSLGSVLYELLTGAQPFGGETIYDVITQVVTMDPPPPAEINRHLDPDLSTICLKALEKDAARRYQSIGEMADDIQAYLSGDAISARPLSAFEKLGRALRRRAKSIVWALAGAAAAAALVFGLWYLLARDRLAEVAENLASPRVELRLSSAENLVAEISAGKFEGGELERAENLIIDKLADKDNRLRRLALKFLAERELDRAGERVVRMINSEPDLEVRMAALRCRFANTPKGLPSALLALARDRGADRDLRLEAIRTLGPVAGLSVKVPLIRLKLANSQDRAFCRAIDRALANITPRNVVLSYYHISESGEALQFAARTISKLQAKDRELQRLIDEIDGVDGPAPKPKKRKPLAYVLTRLKSKKSAQRLMAVHDLGEIGHRDCVKPLIGALRDENAQVALAAAEAAAAIGIDEHSDVVVKVVRDKKLSGGSRGAAAHLLGLAKVRSAAEAIAKSLGAEKNAAAAALMAHALARLGVRKNVEPALAVALSEGAPVLRAAAAEALGKVGARSKEAVEALLKASDDPEKPVAAAATDALTAIAGKDLGADATKWREWWKANKKGWK